MVIIKTSKQISLSIKNNFINSILFLKANNVNNVFKQLQRWIIFLQLVRFSSSSSIPCFSLFGHLFLFLTFTFCWSSPMHLTACLSSFSDRHLPPSLSILLSSLLPFLKSLYTFLSYIVELISYSYLFIMKWSIFYKQKRMFILLYYWPLTFCFPFGWQCELSLWGVFMKRNSCCWSSPFVVLTLCILHNCMVQVLI